MATNKFMERRIEAEILGEVYEELERKLESTTKTYEIVGKEDEQATDYRTGELRWEDEEKTIPYYRDKYDYVDIPEEKLSDEQRLKVKVIKSLMVKLEKL